VARELNVAAEAETVPGWDLRIRVDGHTGWDIEANVLAADQHRHRTLLDPRMAGGGRQVGIVASARNRARRVALSFVAFR